MAEQNQLKKLLSDAMGIPEEALDLSPILQPESKLKKMLLGTPKQRKSREEKFSSDLESWHSAIQALEPGYVLRSAIYLPMDAVYKFSFLFFGTAMTISQGVIAYGIASKLGEYFGK
jgi:hypothetical protein